LTNWLHQIKRLLPIKINNYQNKKTIYRIREDPCQLFIWVKNWHSEYTKILKIKHQKNNEINKWTDKLNRQFSGLQMANKHMRKCSISLAIKEIQIKVTVRFYLTLVWKTMTKSTISHKHCHEWGQNKPSYTVGGKVN
jgi:hypothetical protein